MSIAKKFPWIDDALQVKVAYILGFFFQFLDINVFKFFKTVQKDIAKFKLHFKCYYG